MKYSKALPTFSLALLSLSAYPQYTAEILPTPNGFGEAMGAGGGQIIGAGFGEGGGPFLWEGPPYKKYVNLHPAEFDVSAVIGVGGGKQVGYARVQGDRDHALMWSGSAQKYVDLDVASYETGTLAWNTDGKSQVGAGGVGPSIGHALLWQGTPESVVDLHPEGYQSSQGYGVCGDRQIGNLEGNIPCMWTGAAESMILLPLPKGLSHGFAYAIQGDQIVGSTTDGATLWNADTLEITSLGGGGAIDTNGLQQAGLRGVDGDFHAFAWSGSEESAIDLHQFLPKGYRESRALGIDESGAIVGWARRPNMNQQPFVWTPVPEPSSFLALTLGLGLLGLLARRYKVR
ncbi:MAG: PEP-CTERM sorting domain-containing protein [Armatimonadetes bacterium]|nr:PEP-CTERM sorting domain-containing protein [Armatimonadota bacterium]